MDEKFEPLRWTGPDYISVRSVAKTGYIPLDLIPLLPSIQLIPRDMYIDTSEALFRSTRIISWLRGELDKDQASKVEQLLKRRGVVGVHFPLGQQARPDRGNTPSPSQDSDAYNASSALLALRRTSTPAIDNELPSVGDVTEDIIGFSKADYDRAMEKAMIVCSKANAAEVSEHLQTRQRLLQFCEQLRQQLQECQDAHKQGLMSDLCFQPVTQSLNCELKAKEKQLEGVCEAIKNAEDPKCQFNEAMMLVLKSVAAGCSRKRPRVE